MKRLLISIVLGTLLPLVYTIIVGPLSTYLPDRTANQYLFYPIRWPVLMAYALAPTTYGSPEVSESFLLFFVIAGNILLYSTIVYFLLLAFSRRKSISEPPPKISPPQSSE